MTNYLIEQVRQSNQATLPLRLVYVDYRLIGTHEDQGPKAEKDVYDSMLEQGYNGSPIAVFQFGDDALYKTIGSNAQINETYGVIGVADGHHRFKAIQRLGEQGLLKDCFIPVQLLPAHNSEIVRIDTLLENEPPLSIREVETCFKEPSTIIPICTSHFQTKLVTGYWVRLKEAQPDIKIKREDFLL